MGFGRANSTTAKDDTVEESSSSCCVVEPKQNHRRQEDWQAEFLAFDEQRQQERRSDPKEDNTVITSPSPRRRVIFPYLYIPQSMRRTSNPSSNDVRTPQATQPKPKLQPKALAVFPLPGPQSKDPDDTAKARVDALLSLSPLNTKNNTQGPPLSVNYRSVPIKPMFRPPLTSLEIPEVPEPSNTTAVVESSNRNRNNPPRTRRNILFWNHSMPIPEDPPQQKHHQPKQDLKEVVSILRSKTPSTTTLNGEKTQGETSAPSLMSLEDDEDSSQSSNEISPITTEATTSSNTTDPMSSKPHTINRSATDPTSSKPHTINRSASDPASSATPASKSITFDPRIWVREFERSQEEQETTWYTEDDMELFKRHALALILSRKNTDIIPTGTARMVQRPVPVAKAFFTHSALRLDGEEDAEEALKNEKYRQVVAQNEMKTILLVDPRDICLTLFTKAFQIMLPNVEICTATSSEEAIQYAVCQRFDIILVEERLTKVFHNTQRGCSGSCLIHKLSRMENTENALMVGISAHLEKDRAILEKGGADLCWSKPPPKMSQELRNKLLQTLLIKRGRTVIFEELYGPLPSSS